MTIHNTAGFGGKGAGAGSGHADSSRVCPRGPGGAHSAGTSPWSSVRLRYNTCSARSQADLLITRLGHYRRVQAGVPSRDLRTAPEAAVAGDRDDGMAAGGVHLGYGAALERHDRLASDAISVVGAPGILVGGP